MVHTCDLLLNKIMVSVVLQGLQPTEGSYQPLPDNIVLKPEDFLADLKRSLPGASIFHAWEIQPKDPPFPSPER